MVIFLLFFTFCHIIFLLIFKKKQIFHRNFEELELIFLRFSEFYFFNFMKL